MLVTGATGLLGRALCPRLAEAGYRLRAALRVDSEVSSCIEEKVVVGDISPLTDWRQALMDVELVVHAAARAHVPRDLSQNRALYEAVNAQGTGRLAQAAAQAGVRRLVYVSSIKVNGEATAQRPFRAGDPPNPGDDYGRSKLHGEDAVVTAAAASGMEAVIVRPPLVYGPGVRANFLRLMRWVDSEWPLPLGAIQNQRSLVSVWNLSDLIVELLVNPRAPGSVWLVSDGEDLSTPDLVRRLGRAMQRRVRLVPVPAALLRACAAITGRRAEVARLCDSLRLDITATRALGWSPPVSMDESLTWTAAWYRAERP